MDYEKKYKEALARAREIHLSKDEMEYLFPELKESEDEKILRHLKAVVKAYDMWTERGLSMNDVLAWLEKQGEKPQGKTALEAINKEKVDNANKVEPKFKVDWIVGNKDNSVSHESDYHLWSIKDAKEGDVLTSKSSNLIWIYKDNKHYHACLNMNFIKKLLFIDGFIAIPTDVRPTTKNEQSILFENMKKAGYEWDANKKEVKNIYKKPTNSIWHDNKCIPDNDDKEILVEYNLNNSTRPNHLFHDVAPYDSDSKMFHCYSMHLKLEEIIRWAYMDDILQVVNR